MTDGRFQTIPVAAERAGGSGGGEGDGAKNGRAKEEKIRSEEETPPEEQDELRLGGGRGGGGGEPHTASVGGGQSAVGTRVEGGAVQRGVGWLKVVFFYMYWRGGGVSNRKTIGWGLRS